MLLGDDHELAREAMRSVLSPEHGFEIIAEAADGDAAIRLVRECAPDLVMTDVQMPGLDGLTATRTILANRPATRVVVLTSDEQRPIVLEAAPRGRDRRRRANEHIACPTSAGDRAPHCGGPVNTEIAQSQRVTLNTVKTHRGTAEPGWGAVLS